MTPERMLDNCNDLYDLTTIEKATVIDLMTDYAEQFKVENRLNLIPYFTFHELPKEIQEYFEYDFEGVTEENGTCTLWMDWEMKHEDDYLIEKWLLEEYGNSIKQYRYVTFDIM